jgi:hypothetical protein
MKRGTRNTRKSKRIKTLENIFKYLKKIGSQQNNILINFPGKTQHHLSGSKAPHIKLPLTKLKAHFKGTILSIFPRHFGRD